MTNFEGHTLSPPLTLDAPDYQGAREIRSDDEIVGWLTMDDYAGAEANARFLLAAPHLHAENIRLMAILKKISDASDALSDVDDAGQLFQFALRVNQILEEVE